MLSVPFSCPRAIERHGDERLRLDRRAGDEADARIEVGLVREDRLAVLDRPARDALAERERLAHDLVRPFAPREDGLELALRLVRLVDVDVLVRDQLGERVGDPLEERVEALLGEHVVEDLREPPVRLGRAARDEADLWPRSRIDGSRVGHAASDLIGRRRSPLESASAKIPDAMETRDARRALLARLIDHAPTFPPACPAAGRGARRGRAGAREHACVRARPARLAGVATRRAATARSAP